MMDIRKGEAIALSFCLKLTSVGGRSQSTFTDTHKVAKWSILVRQVSKAGF